MNPASRPHRLADNRVPVYYAGGANIDRFRRLPSRVNGPEDWVGSVSALPAVIRPVEASEDVGVSRLPDGTSLRDAVRKDPIGWLGEALAAALDARRAAGETGLLVKLLDAGERLPVHCHPNRPFAAEHLRSPFGKTEGWIVMDESPGGEVWLGFREEVDIDQLRRWITDQDMDAMLASLNVLPARPGDVFYVPAGVPHAIGPGVMITELQEPTSFSILAEHRPFGLDERQATLSLGWSTALACFDRSAYVGERRERLTPKPMVIQDDSARVLQLFGVDATSYFQALRGDVERGRWRLPHAFIVLVVERGAGTLSVDGQRMDVQAGETFVIPHAAGPATLEGDVRALACLPPTLTQDD